MRFLIASAFAILVLPSLWAPTMGGGPKVAPPPQQKTCAVVEFWPLRFSGDINKQRPLRFKLVAADGTTFDVPVRFTGFSDDVGGNVATAIEASMGETRWQVVRKEDRLVIFSPYRRRGKHSPLKEVYLSSDGAYSVEMLPTVIASENVTVTRDEKEPAGAKGPQSEVVARSKSENRL